MNMANRQAVFEEKLPEYLKATRPRKREILDSVCDVTGCHRKAAIRKFRQLQMKDRHVSDQRGRPAYYTPDVNAALFDVWSAANELCGELLHGSIREYVSILRRDGDWRHSDDATGRLLAMSRRTARRRCEEFEKERGAHHGLSSTKPSHLKSIIPVFKGPWNDLSPGNGQLDTIAHCGTTLLGDCVYSLNYTDACLYWIVLCAQWNKGKEATIESMKSIKGRLPFRWLMEHPDISDEVKEKIKAQHETLNPLRLKREIDAMIDGIMKVNRRGTKPDPASARG